MTMRFFPKLQLTQLELLKFNLTSGEKWNFKSKITGTGEFSTVIKSSIHKRVVYFVAAKKYGCSDVGEKFSKCWWSQKFPLKFDLGMIYTSFESLWKTLTPWVVTCCQLKKNCLSMHLFMVFSPKYGAPEFPCQFLTGKKIHLTGKEFFSLSKLFFPVNIFFSCQKSPFFPCQFK